MKKLAIILSMVLCVTFFNSCKEDEPEPSTNTNQTSNPDSYKLITELKSYTGKTNLEVQTTLAAKDFSYLGGSPLGEELTMHIYAPLDGSAMLLLFETSDTICVSMYSNIVYEKDTAFKYFEKYSNECVAKMKGQNSTYVGSCATIDISDSTFDNHQSFINYYNNNKPNIVACSEEWTTSIEGVGSAYEEGDAMILPMIMYVNIPLTPASFFGEVKNKTLFKKIDLNKLRKK